jgi:YD repeat-containing protein
MKKTILLLLAFSFIFTACKKEEENNQDEEGTENGIYIKTVKSNGEIILKFSYDANHRLTKKNIYYNGSELETTYTYTDGRVAQETAKSGNSIVHQYTYTYDNSGKLSRCDLIGTNAYWEYTYNNNKIVESIQYINGQPGTKNTYSYNGDNMVEAIEYDRFGNIWEMTSRYVMEYDNKNNPYQLHNLPFSEVMDEFANFISPNNQTHVTEYDENGTVEYDTTYSYTYNAQGYPSVVEQTDNGSTITYTVLYE